MKTPRTKKPIKKGAATQMKGSAQKPSSKDAVLALKVLQAQLAAVVADKQDKNGKLTAGQLKKAQAALDETEHAIDILECIQSHSPYR
jgi:hypothetical protein